MEKQFGKYTLLERLGGGGMAEVFRARLTGPAGFEKQVAIKLILPHVSDDPEFVRMFIHEATLAARLDHANIVRIHEFDRIEDRYYIAMELVEGRDLRQVIAEARKIERRLGTAESVIIAAEICKGLAFAHGEITGGAPEIIHRDISPHNVILSRAGEVKISDFGIAKIASAVTMTQTGVVRGKAGYMSPEQAAGLPLDRRTDLFSVGCVLFEMLTGRRLFAGQTDFATLSALQSAPICAPSVYSKDIPPALDELTLHALERDREQRLSQASEMARGLDQILFSLPYVERHTALVRLFQDLFGQEARGAKGTSVFPSAGTKTPAPPAASSSSAEPNSGSAARGKTLPPGPERDRSLATPPEVTPIPEAVAPTQPGASVTQVSFRQRRRRGLIWAALGSLILVGLGGVLRWTLIQNGGGQSSPRGEPSTGLAAVVAGSSRVQPDAGEADGSELDAPKTSLVRDVPAEEAAPAKGEKGPPEDPRHVQRYGSLSIDVEPWAEVYLGHNRLGETPLEQIRLPVGTHILTLVNPELGLRRTLSVLIRAGQTTKEKFKLAP